MRSLHIALAFLKDPRLFRQLLLWPLLIGGFLATGQIMISSLYLHLLEETPEQFKQRVERKDSGAEFIQKLLYGNAALPSTPTMCRWTLRSGEELPPDGRDCVLDPLDIVIRPERAPTDLSTFEGYFAGAARRIHVCESCSSDIIIDFQGGKTASRALSLKAIGVFILAQENRNAEVNNYFLQAKEAAQNLENLTGTVLLQAKGMEHPMDMTHATVIMVFVINTCMLIVGALWLTLNGYRKVLRCFAENNALLPLVAVCGKWEFYLSIWIITVVRVSLFLLFCVPMAFIAYRAAVPEETRLLFMPKELTFFAWLFAVSSSLALVTVVASLSELLRRHSFFSIIYRYVPLVLVLSGTAFWTYSMIVGEPTLLTWQKGVVCVPILGLSPVILTPIISQPVLALLVHGVFALSLVWFLLKRHATWFASHLEEV